MDAPMNYKIFWEYAVDIWFPIFILIILLYIYILYVLITAKSAKLRSPFFVMFIVIGLADVVDAIATEYIRLSQRVGMGPKYGWLLQITTALTGSNFCMHLVGNTLMSMFQFTAIWCPIAHSKIWGPRCLALLLFLTITIPLGVYSHLFFTEFDFKVDSLGRWVYTGRKEPITKTRILDSVVTILQEVSCSFMLIAVVVGIRMKTAANFKRMIPEKSLVLVEIVKVVFGSMQAMYGFIFLFNINIDNNFVLGFIFHEFVSYFFFLVTLNAITLPLVSRTFRREIMIRWFKNTTTVTVLSGDLSSNSRRY